MSLPDVRVTPSALIAATVSTTVAGVCRVVAHEEERSLGNGG